MSYLEKIIRDLNYGEIKISKERLVTNCYGTIAAYKKVYVSAEVKAGDLLFNDNLLNTGNYPPMNLCTKPFGVTLSCAHYNYLTTSQNSEFLYQYIDETGALMQYHILPTDPPHQQILDGVNRVRQEILGRDFSYLEKRGKPNLNAISTRLSDFNIDSPESIKSIVDLMGIMKSKSAISGIKWLWSYLQTKDPLSDSDFEQIYNMTIVNSVHKE